MGDMLTEKLIIFRFVVYFWGLKYLKLQSDQILGQYKEDLYEEEIGRTNHKLTNARLTLMQQLVGRAFSSVDRVGTLLGLWWEKQESLNVITHQSLYSQESQKVFLFENILLSVLCMLMFNVAIEEGRSHKKKSLTDFTLWIR